MWLDDVPVGVISSLRLAAGRVTVRGFAQGTHRYSVILRLYALDRGMQLTSVGVATGEGTIHVRGGEVFALWWAPEGQPTLRLGAR